MEKEKKRVLVAGSYDPVTKGHMMLIEYAAAHYEEVFVVMFVNAEKEYLFTVEERRALLEAACKGYTNVTVDYWEGMQYQYAEKMGIDLVIRGYRGEADLEYEHRVADFNRKALPGFETLLLPSGENERQITSTAIRQMLGQKRDVSPYVPGETLDLLADFAEKKKWKKM